MTGGNMARLEATVAALPEAQRVDVEAWGEIAELVETSYRLVAPKTLVKRLDV